MDIEEVASAAPLSKEQLGVLRERLERLRGDLRARLARDSAVARTAEPEIEPLDVAEQTREQDDAILRLGHDRALLREVEDALARMGDGSYGTSDISGEPIPFERLRAIPWARHDSDED